MQQKHISYQLLALEEVAADERELLLLAQKATEFAYAPYSKFQVGAALQLSNGEVITGNNQENRAYPSGLCAERTALYYAGSLGKSLEIRKIAIRAVCKSHPVLKPITPCGACRQVMAEYEEIAQQNFVVLMQGESGDVLRIEGVRETLLPFAFDAEF